MQVGILTFHNNENIGALLQTWSLVNAIETEFSHLSVEVIDYRTLSKEFVRMVSPFVTSNLSEIPYRIRNRKSSSKFIHNHVPISDEKIWTNNSKKAASKINNLSYDLLIVGSDEVWKVIPSDGTISSALRNRPFPNMYFLDASIQAPKISYAASANRLNPDSLTSSQIQEIKHRVSNFNRISVRDNYTRKLLEGWEINHVTKVPDPTILCDIPTEPVEDLLKRLKIDTQRPTLGIHGVDGQLFETICKSYKERGYQIVSLTHSDFADVNLRGRVDPFEYYTIFSKFDMVVTESLHSTIFSIKHATPFATIDTEEIYEHVESKTQSLLDDFDLSDRHFHAVTGSPEGFFDRVEHVEQPLDEEQIENCLNEQQEVGLSFLKESIKEYEKNS